jgi:hypothetical protein
MKLRTIANENTKKRIKLLITESQFKALIKNVNLLDEQNKSKKKYIIIDKNMNQIS